MGSFHTSKVNDPRGTSLPPSTSSPLQAKHKECHSDSCHKEQRCALSEHAAVQPRCRGALAVAPHCFSWSSVSTLRFDQEPQDAWQSKAPEGFRLSNFWHIPLGRCSARETPGHKSPRTPKRKQVPALALSHGQIPGRDLPTQRHLWGHCWRCEAKATRGRRGAR